MEKIFYLIPVYNAEKTILDTLESIEFYSKFEPKIIIVDDGSTDSTNKIVIDYARKNSLVNRIKLVKQQNSGVASALNRGLKEIPNDVWIFRLDADDCDVLGRQQEMIEFMKSNNLDMAGSYIREFGQSNSLRKYPTCDSAIRLALNFDLSPFAHPSIVFSPQIIKFIRYPVVCEEDLELFKSLKKKEIKFGNLQYPKVLYRVHNSQITKTNEFIVRNQNMGNIFKVTWQILLTKNITIIDKVWILRRALKLGMLFK
jgi:glycosyltransferase involved in cell wall biosynthesis